jgi:hypothetical protein
MFTLINSGWTRNLREGLLLDQVLSLEAIEQIENLKDNLAKEGKKAWLNLLFSFGQPFHVPMKQRWITLNFVNLKAGKLQSVDISTQIAGKFFFVGPIPICLIFS